MFWGTGESKKNSMCTRRRGREGWREGWRRGREGGMEGGREAGESARAACEEDHNNKKRTAKKNATISLFFYTYSGHVDCLLAFLNPSRTALLGGKKIGSHFE